MIGVVADDITGANDIGIMFAKAGSVVHVYSFREGEPIRLQGKPDVLILDTDSRFDSSERAYAKVEKATRTLMELGVTQYFNKTCSVFRGNIGAEFDAMLDELGEEFAVIVLGFPKNGRQTLNGTHYVHGVKLENSEFRHDPMHPMTESNLVDILQKQTKRRVGLIPIAEVEKGAEHIKRLLTEKKQGYHYVILDVADQGSLRIIAEALQDERIICGSSAVAEELALLSDADSRGDSRPDLPPRPGTGILCAAGSLMPQTAAQIAFFKEKGGRAFELNTLELFDEDEREAVTGQLSSVIANLLRDGQHVLIHSANDPELVRRTKEKGSGLSISEAETSQIVSGTIAEIAARCLAMTGQNRLVVAGGDTSAAVCRRLGVEGLRVWREIEPGLPSCVSLTDPAIMLVLKSGSFGSPQFFHRAISHLEEQSE